MNIFILLLVIFFLSIAGFIFFVCLLSFKEKGKKIWLLFSLLSLIIIIGSVCILRCYNYNNNYYINTIIVNIPTGISEKNVNNIYNKSTSLDALKSYIDDDEEKQINLNKIKKIIEITHLDMELNFIEIMIVKKTEKPNEREILNKICRGIKNNIYQKLLIKANLKAGIGTRGPG